MHGNDVFIDLTEENGKQGNHLAAEALEMNDVIITEDIPRNERVVAQMDVISIDDFIPDRVYWENILATLEQCSTDAEFEKKST